MQTLVCKGWDLTKLKPTMAKQVLKEKQSHLLFHADTVASAIWTYPCVDKEAVRKLVLMLKLKLASFSLESWRSFPFSTSSPIHFLFEMVNI